MKTPTSSFWNNLLYFVIPFLIAIALMVGSFWVERVIPDSRVRPVSEITSNGTVAFKLDGHSFFTHGDFAAARHATNCACGWTKKLAAVGGWGTTNGGPFPVTNGGGR